MFIYILYIIYEIMKTMCPPAYHHNDFVATHALGHSLCTSCAKRISCHKAILLITRSTHCFHDAIFLKPILLL